ncbi:hypothetical protein B0H34DRAFT_338298 [Crassisporium funariophilum]|nr:hypothetical protein B0H34DRAFT_338298 [Crassisporium funariophilum]
MYDWILQPYFTMGLRNVRTSSKRWSQSGIRSHLGNDIGSLSQVDLWRNKGPLHAEFFSPRRLKHSTARTQVHPQPCSLIRSIPEFFAWSSCEGQPPHETIDPNVTHIIYHHPEREVVYLGFQLSAPNWPKKHIAEGHRKCPQNPTASPFFSTDSFRAREILFGQPRAAITFTTSL